MFNLRIAEKSDAPMLAAHNCAMAFETENKSLELAVATLGAEGLFQRPELGFYLIAETDSIAAATLLVTYEWSDWRNGLFWWIQSVYVKPAYRRQGVYSKMYAHLKELALSQPTPVCGFRLYAETDNQAAQATYKNLGMHACEYVMFEESVV
ncbi:MAG: ribosomal protein S18 acetylase RimI-like enzyme [Oceanospirillaceae bacterium]|jgi:ribosomal protein S18 acetylase RimI-like enzyme|tara:strand:- start:84 stop:539 length:456 start_codon:yes stop_codon:yes gene_type:complete